MQKKIIGLLMATFLCAISQSQGQLVQPQAKKALVRLPEQGGRWTVQIKPRATPRPLASSGETSEAPLPGPTALRSIEVVSNKDIRRDRLQWSDGTSTELWKINGEWFFPIGSQEVHAMSMFPGAHLFEGWKKFENGELQQIVKSGTGVLTKFREIPAMLYTATHIEKTQSYFTDTDLVIQALKAKAPDSRKIPQGLFVDPETSYPIAYLDPSGEYDFSNIVEGPQNLEVPAKFAVIAKRLREMLYAPVPPNHP